MYANPLGHRVPAYPQRRGSGPQNFTLFDVCTACGAVIAPSVIDPYVAGTGSPSWWALAAVWFAAAPSICASCSGERTVTVAQFCLHSCPKPQQCVVVTRVLHCRRQALAIAAPAQAHQASCPVAPGPLGCPVVLSPTALTRQAAPLHRYVTSPLTLDSAALVRVAGQLQTSVGSGISRDGVVQGLTLAGPSCMSALSKAASSGLQPPCSRRATTSPEFPCMPVAVAKYHCRHCAIRITNNSRPSYPKLKLKRAAW